MEYPEEFQTLADAIENNQKDVAVTETKELVNNGYTAVNIFQEAIVPCMTDIGDRFSTMELFLPDMIRAADVVKAIHETLAKDMEKSGGSVETQGKIVIGTVFGDLHDIGKNIVSTMLEVNGFEIYDLGVGVEATDFIQKAREIDADVIALSSLLTTSIPYIEDVIDLIKDNEKDSERFKIMIGGGAVTPDIAERNDVLFGRDAAQAVKQARQLTS